MRFCVFFPKKIGKPFTFGSCMKLFLCKVNQKFGFHFKKLYKRYIL
jgi:hypothetical protein